MHRCQDGQFYLEELVKQKGEPVGKHLLSHRLCPAGGEAGETANENRKSRKSDSACVEKKTVGLGGIYDRR